MRIIFFGHPTFINSQSMPRFLQMLVDGMRIRGHEVEVWQPKAKFFNYRVPVGLKKWMGYIDQYLLFPREIKKKLRQEPKDTLFVFADQALGPWVSLVCDRKHVIHCHDFLAQRSALNEIPQNPVGWTGKIYQSYIRNGYKKGKCFISVSKKTQQDLHRFLGGKPLLSKVVYNGLNGDFNPLNFEECRKALSTKWSLNLNHGYWLHVGGNQWYKNRATVIELYTEWRKITDKVIPLIMIGEKPDYKLNEAYIKSLFNNDIYFIQADDQEVKLAYSGASLLLFPSIAEGFGWPIAEAMASGCIVVTTDEMPMTEVGGSAAVLIPAITTRSSITDDIVKVLDDVLNLKPDELNVLISKGLENVKRFNQKGSLDEIEQLYLDILSI